MSRRIKNGFRTPQWKIDAMRLMWGDGEPMSAITTQLDISKETVSRYCRELPRPQPDKFTNSDRQQLLRRWRAA